MEILTADFIEFGELNVNGDFSKVAIVHGEWLIQEMTEAEFDDLIEVSADWINLNDWDGEIYFNKEAQKVKA